MMKMNESRKVFLMSAKDLPITGGGDSTSADPSARVERGQTVGDVGEIACVDQIRRILGTPHEVASVAGIPRAVQGRPVIAALRDDAAVLEVTPKLWLLVATDIINEGTEFFRDSDPEAIGYLALMAGVSDIAAKGVRPVGAAVAWSIPAELSMQTVEGIARGIRKASQRFTVPLLAGDLNESKEMIFSSTAIGLVSPSRVVLRRGASVGEYVIVSGTLGGYTAGFLVTTRRLVVRPDIEEAVKRRFLWPEPRIDWACELASNCLVSSMLDLSDGLLTGAQELVRANDGEIGVELVEEDLPLMSEAVHVMHAAGESRDVLLSGEGGDYELMMTVRPAHWPRVQALARKKGMELAKVGSIRSDKGLFLRRRDGRVQQIFEGGFHQFGASRLTE